MPTWGNGPIIPACPYWAVQRSTRRYGNNGALRELFTIRVHRRPISSVLGAQALIVRMIDEGRVPTLDELANVLFVSRSHLCSAFSRETGQSIGHYAGARRMERTETMLVGCCSVAQVATRLGWTRCSTFSQAFKRSTGVSPIEWRNSNSQ